MSDDATATIADAGAPGSTAKKKLAPGAKRNLLILGGVAAAAVLAMGAVVLNRGSNSPSATVAGGPTTLPTAGATGTEVNAAPTPAQAALLAEKQRMEAAAARASGQAAYIPPDSGAAVSMTPGAPVRSADGTYAGSNGQGNYQPPAQPTQEELNLAEQYRQQIERMRAGAKEQLNAMTALSAPRGGFSRVTIAGGGGAGDSRLQISSASVNAGTDGREIAGRGGAVASGVAVGAAQVVADALEIFGGATLSPVDTYRTGYISARIASGALAGAFLVGTTTLVNEGLQPRFTQMRFNGATYKINAIALDEATATNAVSANLDRRILQRYVMPIAMAAVGGAASALARPSEAVTSLGTGSTAVVTASATRDQAVAAGVAAAVGMGQRAVDADASLPIQATLPAGTPIGIMFVEPVLTSDSAVPAQVAAGQQFGRDRAEANAANSALRPMGVGGYGQGPVMPGYPGGLPATQPQARQ